ncbi:hypothetical protein [Chelativorans sp.]|uniref:hypothetical protein n=1 Tax=Chelativorans sp. TaxID=2203393 RepID=UPI0028110A8A|nr:hypothetical protein [Chelativorans sp.]
MADSDNTTSLSFVTRRRVLAGSVIAAGTWASPGNALAHFSAVEQELLDPALALWREWEIAHRLAERLCRKQQRLETKLARSIGFPRVIVSLPDGERVTVHSVDELDELFDQNPGFYAIRAKAEAEFAAHQARWDAADAEVGYSAALRAEREAGEQAAELLEALAVTPATSLAGIAGKLDAVLRSGEAWEDCSEFPWPQIRSALNDLVRVGEHLAPGQFFPSARRRRARQCSEG